MEVKVAVMQSSERVRENSLNHSWAFIGKPSLSNAELWIQFPIIADVVVRVMWMCLESGVFDLVMLIIIVNNPF